jgi:hypothetical protein
MEAVVRVAGLDVGLSAGDDRRWVAIDALFGGCPSSISTTQPQLRLRFVSEPPAVPEREPDVRHEWTDVWFDESGLACRSAGGVAARRGGDEIVVGGPADVGALPARALATAFRRSVQHVLADALAEHGRHTLHGASVSITGDGVIVAVGGPGAGKSTLAYAAALRGWGVLGDDLTFLALDDRNRANGELLVAWGLPKPLNIPRDVLTDAGAGSALPGDERDRVEIPLGADPQRAPLPVAAVALLEHADGEGRLAPVAPRPELLKLLLASFPLVLDRRRFPQLFRIAAALSRLPVWTLYHDADPARRVASAAALLGELAGGAGTGAGAAQ